MTNEQYERAKNISAQIEHCKAVIELTVVLNGLNREMDKLKQEFIRL